jgi:hypothetical protein
MNFKLLGFHLFYLIVFSLQITCAPSIYKSNQTIPSYQSEFKSVSLDNCEITFIKNAYWRDCMPGIFPDREGSPDGCSRLITLDSFQIQNTSGIPQKFAIKAVIIDSDGKTYIPPTIELRYSKDGSSWNGEISSRQDFNIEIVTRGGPFLSIDKSKIQVETTWVDQAGNSIKIKSPVSEIGEPI